MNTASVRPVSAVAALSLLQRPNFLYSAPLFACLFFTPSSAYLPSFQFMQNENWVRAGKPTTKSQGSDSLLLCHAAPAVPPNISLFASSSSPRIASVVSPHADFHYSPEFHAGGCKQRTNSSCGLQPHAPCPSFDASLNDAGAQAFLLPSGDCRPVCADGGGGGAGALYSGRHAWPRPDGRVH